MEGIEMRAAQRWQGMFYGWIIVVAALVIIGVGVGLMFMLGVFMEPLESDLGWTRGQIARASLYSWLAFGVFSFVFGSLSDRFGTRLVVMIGGVMFGLGMVGLSQLQALWQFYLLYGLLVGGGIGAFMVPLTATITRWFTRHQSLVVAVVNCGIGIGGLLFAPLTRYLIIISGWRATFFLYGLLIWAVILPLAWLIRNRPEDMELLPYGDTSPEVKRSAGTEPMAHAFGTVLATPVFWRIAVVHFLCCAAHSGPIFHMVSAVIDTGTDKLAAATVFAIGSLASIPGRIGTGLLADRFGSKIVLITWLTMQATAVFLYLFAGGFGSFVMLALYFGLAYGGVMPLYPVVTREYFGARAMGASYGAIFLLSCFGMGLGAWAGGRIFDSTGTYQGMYLLSFFLAGVGAVLAIWLRAPLAPPATVLMHRAISAS